MATFNDLRNWANGSGVAYLVTDGEVAAVSVDQYIALPVPIGAQFRFTLHEALRASEIQRIKKEGAS